MSCQHSSRTAKGDEALHKLQHNPNDPEIMDVIAKLRIDEPVKTANKSNAQIVEIFIRLLTQGCPHCANSN